MTLADRLKALRKKRKISIYKLSKEIEVPYTTVRSWESGVAKPRDRNIKKLSDYYDCEPAWLRYGKEESLSPEVMRLARKIEKHTKRFPDDFEKVRVVVEALIK